MGGGECTSRATLRGLRMGLVVILLGTLVGCGGQSRVRHCDAAGALLGGKADSRQAGVPGRTVSGGDTDSAVGVLCLRPT